MKVAYLNVKIIHSQRAGVKLVMTQAKTFFSQTLTTGLWQCWQTLSSIASYFVRLREIQNPWIFQILERKRGKWNKDSRNTCWWFWSFKTVLDDNVTSCKRFYTISWSYCCKIIYTHYSLLCRQRVTLYTLSLWYVIWPICISCSLLQLFFYLAFFLLCIILDNFLCNNIVYSLFISFLPFYFSLLCVCNYVPDGGSLSA